jgi:hypothetical protein
MSRVRKLRVVFLKSARRGPLPRSVWPRPDRAIPPMDRVKEEREASSGAREPRRIAHRANGMRKDGL